MRSCIKVSSLIIFVILFVSLPLAAKGAMNGMIVKPSITRTAEGLSVAYEIRNMGTDTAKHLTVTTFLARITNHSDVLGDILRDQTIRFKTQLDTADLLPGEYVMATRIDFSGTDGRTQRTYHFSGVTIKTAEMKKDAAVLDIHLKSPAFNPKSFWHPQGKFILTLENKFSQSIEPVVFFFLPDGFSVSEPEKIYTLAAREKKSLTIPLHFESDVGVQNPYSVVVWYETDGRHYSQLINGTIRVEAKPFYFKLFLVVSGIIVLALAVVYFVRRRKHTA